VGGEEVQRKMKMEVIENWRLVPKERHKAVLLDASDRFFARQLERRVRRVSERQEFAPDRRSTAIAMLAVEDRLVRAFWTIARQPARHIAPGSLARCGLDYVPGETDREAGYKDAAGGDWRSVAPRPPIPSGKEIDQANEALDWLLHVDESRRKILVVGATSKRGDVGRQISWPRVRQAIPSLAGLSTRTLQGRYREALRIIVTELTLARLAK